MGLYMAPTIVNNVETLCHVKHIIGMSGEDYAKIGTPRNTGTRILCVSGDVQKPGYYEIEVGKMTMGELLNDLCGGPKEDRSFKAVIPGGSSAKILRCSDKFNVSCPPDTEKREINFEEIPLDLTPWQHAGQWLAPGE